MDHSVPMASAAADDNVEEDDGLAQDALAGPLDLFGYEGELANDDEEESLFVGNAAATSDWMHDVVFGNPHSPDKAGEEASNMAAEAIEDTIASAAAGAETEAAADAAGLAADTAIQTVEGDENMQEDVEDVEDVDDEEGVHEDKGKAVESAAWNPGSEEANESSPDILQYDGGDHDWPSVSPSSRLQIVLTPVPRNRRDDYATLPPSRYVGKIVKRLRGKNRFQLEYDDGRRSEVSSV